MANSEAISTTSSATSVADSTDSTAVSSTSTVSQASSAAQSVSSTATSSASSVASAVSNSSSAASSTVSSTSASSSASSSEPVHLTDQEIYDLNHPKTYMAKAGEDLVSICNRFGVSYGSVANINHFRNAVRPWTNRPYQPPMLLKLRV